ncbi:MAG: twin-arginine translocase subunit TatB [Betaproteobacteria bacterium TMED82]|nr:MAG: twin-arginine translocase subunit TatB [Betaproteobacteria bacterium TMED82]
MKFFQVIDVGFFELLLVGLAGLVIIGPKKLPVAFRTLGSLVAKARNYVSDVRSEIEKEMSLEELRATERTIKDIGGNYTEELSNLQKEIQNLEKEATINFFDQAESKKVSFYISSPVLSWEDENFQLKLRDRVRKRLRKRFLKKRKFDD